MCAGCCPNLLAEAGLYRYGDEGESPVDEHNHALAALRYLVLRLDAHKLARLAKDKARAAEAPAPPPAAAPARPRKKRDPWLNFQNPLLWTRIF